MDTLLDKPLFYRMPIVRPLHWEVIELLQRGAFMVGGFPLYLCGGADKYSDIDTYAADSTVYARLNSYFKRYPAFPLKRTAHAQPYILKRISTRFDLADPGFKDFDWHEVLKMADLSPAATGLIWRDDQPVIMALYPNDIASRRLRILEHHEWTEYRVKSYEDNGYHLDP